MNNDNQQPQQNPLTRPEERSIHGHLFEVVLTGFGLALGAALYHRFFHNFLQRRVDGRSKRAQNPYR